MALITCGDCKNQYSDGAKACPACGKPKPASLGAGSIVLLAAVGLVSFKACSGPPSPASTEQSASQVAEIKARQDFQAKQYLQERTTDCNKTIDDRKAAYAKASASKKFWDARTSLGDCPEVLKDPILLKMQSDASRLSFVATAQDQKQPPDERIRAIEHMKAAFPDDAVQFEPLLKPLQVAAEKKAAADMKRSADAEKARRRKEGVSLGMTADDVRASSWGRPEKVNRSTYKFGVREQWVYPGGYLYFEDGVLTSIQN